MTLWDLITQWLRARRQARGRRHPWMTQWPYRSKPQRFNIIQRYLMRRGVWMAVLLVVFKVNPLHPATILLTTVGLSLMWTEHAVHERQRRALYNIKRRWHR
jgi:hypothetical protein